MTIGRIVTIVLEVADLERSTGFYKDALGLDLHSGADNAMPGDRWISGDHAAISWVDGAFFHFALYRAKSDVTRSAQIGFSTSDLGAAHARLVAAGAPVIHPPRQEPWGQTARYRDPDGNVVSLTQND